MRMRNAFEKRSAGLTARSITKRTGCFVAIAPLVLGMAMFWPFGGGNKIVMSGGQIDPAAQGTISIHAGHNGNTDVDTKVKFLAKPSSLTPPENVYVVWFQPDGQAAVNEGALKVDKNLNGELKTETPYKRFKVFVTAEKTAQVKAPTGPDVLTANVAQS